MSSQPWHIFVCTVTALQQIAKGDCIYTLAVSSGDDSSTMLQIPVTLQCNGNLQHSFNSQLQQQSQNASQQYTQQQFDQVGCHRS